MRLKLGARSVQVKSGEPAGIGFNGNRAHFGGPLQKPRWSVLNAEHVRQFYLRNLSPFGAVQVCVAQVRFGETRAGQVGLAEICPK